MATCSRAVWRVVSGCQRLGAVRPVYSSLSQTPAHTVPVRTLGAARTKKKDKKDEEQKEVKKKKQQRVIDNTGRAKPFGFTAWAPVDDVYILRHYPRKVHRAGDAVDLLQTYGRLDFTPKHQPVYIDFRLNMKLEKKKKVDPFVSTVRLPHPFKTEMNKVLVFTEDPDEVKEAQENGAAIVGGPELVQPILDDDISADFYVAVPEIIPKLTALKNKLRKKFPKSRRGSVGEDISKMLDLFKMGHEYIIVEDCYVRTQIATLDMPAEHIMENLRSMITDVCSHKPAEFGPFIERGIISSKTSEGLWISPEDLLPQTTEDTAEE